MVGATGRRRTKAKTPARVTLTVKSCAVFGSTLAASADAVRNGACSDCNDVSTCANGCARRTAPRSSGETAAPVRCESTGISQSHMPVAPDDNLSAQSGGGMIRSLTVEIKVDD